MSVTPSSCNTKQPDSSWGRNHPRLRTRDSSIRDSSWGRGLSIFLKMIVDGVTKGRTWGRAADREKSH